MKLDQVAFYCLTKNAEDIIKRTFPLSPVGWIKDVVECENKIYPRVGAAYKCEAIGELQFNYSLGIEFEILRYRTGSSWHNHLHHSIALQGSILPFISHIGYHLGVGEDFPDKNNMAELNWHLVQETKTFKHSNPYLIEKKRTYEYQIYEGVPGTYIKYIKRIEAR